MSSYKEHIKQIESTPLFTVNKAQKILECLENAKALLSDTFKNLEGKDKNIHKPILDKNNKIIYRIETILENKNIIKKLKRFDGDALVRTIPPKHNITPKEKENFQQDKQKVLKDIAEGYQMIRSNTFEQLYEFNRNCNILMNTDSTVEQWRTATKKLSQIEEALTPWHIQLGKWASNLLEKLGLKKKARVDINTDLQTSANLLQPGILKYSGITQSLSQQSDNFINKHVKICTDLKKPKISKPLHSNNLHNQSLDNSPRAASLKRE